MPSVETLLEAFDCEDPAWEWRSVLGHDAVLTKGDVLCCEGSSDTIDWVKNVVVWPAGEGPAFHVGFLEEAAAVKRLCPRVPRAIVGFSRGAAVGAILGYMWDVPVLALACPNYVWRFGPRPEARVLHVSMWFDPVTWVPVATYTRLRGVEVRIMGAGHNLDRYRRAVLARVGDIEPWYAKMHTQQWRDGLGS